MKRRKTAIPSSWLSLLPGTPLSVWFQVAQEAKRRRVRKANLAKIKEIACSITRKSP